jgi:hypothetical protein
MSRAWYQLALAPATASSTVTLVAAAGDHLGEAVAAVTKAFPRRAILAARQSPGAPLGDSVGKSRQPVEQGSAAELPTVSFAWPAGVLPELSALERLSAATSGYVVRERGELLTMEAQVHAGGLREAFLAWIEELPAADNLEVRLMDHFEDAGFTDVWLTPRIGVKQVLRFLDAHDRELIDNGCVELAVYLRKERSTLRLTEHKTLVWTSMDASTEPRVARTLSKLGIAATSELVGLAAGPHFHLRPDGTRDRVALSRYLKKQRLRLVDRVDRHGASLGAPAS